MSELNPHLGETLHEVFQLLAATLLRINRLAYVAPCLLQARALHAKLRQVQLGAVGMSEGQLSEIEEEIALKAATLAAALAVERHYVRQADARGEGGPMSPLALAAAAVRTRAQLEDQSAGGLGLSYDPRYLIFEFTTSIILRETQVRLVEKFVGTLTEGRSLVSQLIMGAGKTTTIAPLLALLIADGSQLVMQAGLYLLRLHLLRLYINYAGAAALRCSPYSGSTYYGCILTTQVVPPALLTFSRAVLRERFSSFVSKPVYTFAFERALDVTDGLLLKLTTAVARRAVVCTTPAALKSFALKFLEVLRLYLPWVYLLWLHPLILATVILEGRAHPRLHRTQGARQEGQLHRRAQVTVGQGEVHGQRRAPRRAPRAGAPLLRGGGGHAARRAHAGRGRAYRCSNPNP